MGGIKVLLMSTRFKCAIQLMIECSGHITRATTVKMHYRLHTTSMHIQQAHDLWGLHSSSISIVSSIEKGVPVMV